MDKTCSNKKKGIFYGVIIFKCGNTMDGADSRIVDTCTTT